MGGTFDHLHEGHKLLIETALSLSKLVVIGLTDEKLHDYKKYKSKIETYNFRKQNLESFIKSITDQQRVEIVKLTDSYGPPIHEAEYEAIIVSQETYNGAIKINEIRESKNFPPLIIIVIPMLKNTENKIISSTLIREKLE